MPGGLAAVVVRAGLVDEGVTVVLEGKMRLKMTIKMQMRMLKRYFLLKEKRRLLSKGVAAKRTNYRQDLARSWRFKSC